LRIKLETSEPLHSSKKHAWEDDTQTSPKHVTSTSAAASATQGDSQHVTPREHPVSCSFSHRSISGGVFSLIHSRRARGRARLEH
jgi:hypothetical protein